MTSAKHTPATVTAATKCPIDKRPCQRGRCGSYVAGECREWRKARSIGLSPQGLNDLDVDPAYLFDQRLGAVLCAAYTSRSERRTVLARSW